MGPSAGLRGRGLLAGLVVLLLCSCVCQQAAAQNYTALRNGVMLPPQCQIDNVTEANELAKLMEKLPQVKGTPAEQQLQFLSASSRSKLNNLTGNAEEWLKNRTATQLEEMFEDVRSTNFRRMMALASITSQLRGAFTSSNVLRALELLQTEDLERLASLPLFEERYQRLTNVTFLELIQQLYSFGLTQVPRRTCLLTAANSSDFSRLPNAEQSAQSDGIYAANFSAIRGDAAAPVYYNVLSYDPLTGTNSGKRRRGRSLSRHRRRLLDVFAGGWRHLDDDDATDAVVQAVTQGPGLAGPGVRRMLFQTYATTTTADGAGASPTTDNTVAPIVTKFLDGLQQTTGPDGSTTFSTPGSQTATPESTQEAINSLLSRAVTVPGIPTQPGFLDTRAVGSGCSETMGIMRLRSSSSSGSANTANSRRSGSSSAGSSKPVQAVANKTAEAGPVNCTAGLVFNGTACVPCPAGTVLEGSLCVCANGTSWNTTLSTCVPTGQALPPASPCANGTSTNGTGCGAAAPAANATAPAAGNATAPGVALNSTGVLNGSEVPLDGGIAGNATQLPAVLAPNATLGGDAVPLNGSVVAAGDVVPANGSLIAGGEVLQPTDLNGSYTLPAGAGVDPAAVSNDTGVLINTPQVLTPVAGDGSSNGTVPATLAPPVVATPGSDYNTSGVLPAQQPGEVAQPALVPVVDGLAAGVSPAPATDVLLPAGSVVADPAGAVAASPTPALVDVQPLAGTQQVLAPEVFAPGPYAATPASSPALDTQVAAGGATVLPAAEGVVQQPAGVAPSVVQPVTPVITPTVTPTVTPQVLQPSVVAPAEQQPAVKPADPVTVVQPTVVQAPPVVAPAAADPIVLPAVACVGQWVEEPTCPAPCEGTGTKTATFKVTTPAANGGAPCEVPDGSPKQVPCSNPTACVKIASPPVNCVGSWGPPTGPCTGPCQGAGTQISTYTVTTPEANGGAPCEAASGATKPVPCTNTDPCPVNCVGAWGPPGECKAACSSPGTQTSVYTITTPAAHGGAPCEAAAGQTRETACTNPTPCPVDCVGEWGPPGACDATACESRGKQTAVYTITTPAANGGRACAEAAGATRLTDCTNPNPCPKAIEPEPVVTAPPPPPEPVVSTPAPVAPPLAPAPVVVTPEPVKAPEPEPVKPAAGGNIVAGGALPL